MSSSIMLNESVPGAGEIRSIPAIDPDADDDDAWDEDVVEDAAPAVSFGAAVAAGEDTFDFGGTDLVRAVDCFAAGFFALDRAFFDAAAIGPDVPTSIATTNTTLAQPAVISTGWFRNDRRPTIPVPRVRRSRIDSERVIAPSPARPSMSLYRPLRGFGGHV
jgi:hypothetical protein